MPSQQGKALRIHLGKGGFRFDSRRAREELGWTTRDIETSLKDTVEEFIARGNVPVNKALKSKECKG